MLLDKDSRRLQHISEYGQAAIDYCTGKTLADLERDVPGRSHLARCLEVVGEAANHVSPELRAAHPHVPWRSMIRLRNRIIHAYMDLNIGTMWLTIKQQLPEVVEQARQILREKGHDF
ncbi:MAG: DUF86 domain-containing protein [Candidatus Hydrogenedentes bacterium]|nr:DUF86 domain-containing protein [Candidatus Hydrogenedentota bacterium]MBI3118158.1 DUF86 domain-containing protein [Candidatus Hydrogenedentota bacterium]